MTRAIPQAEQVAAIGDAIGRELRWEELSPEEIQHQLAGVPDTALETWRGFVEAPEIVTMTVQELTGRPARSFAQWASDNSAAFR